MKRSTQEEKRVKLLLDALREQDAIGLADSLEPFLTALDAVKESSSLAHVAFASVDCVAVTRDEDGRPRIKATLKFQGKIGT